MFASSQDSPRTSVHHTSTGHCAKRSTGRDVAATSPGQDRCALGVYDMIKLPVYNGAHRELGVQFITRAELSDAIDDLLSEELAKAKAKTSGTKPHSTGATPEMKQRELYEHQPEHTADWPCEHHLQLSTSVLRCAHVDVPAEPGSLQVASTDSLDRLDQPKSKVGGSYDRLPTALRPSLIVILRYA